MTGGEPEKASTASTADCAIAIICTMTSSLRLSDRSAMRPAHAPSTSTGRELAGREHADREAAVGEVQDEQGLGDQRQPVADLRDELAEEEQAEVADVQRLERCPELLRRSAFSRARVCQIFS